uniref:Sporulation protein n=1 Tax=Heterorhabditis bacteriophora TaxID=37862 RepID=A0A1I7WFX0_HETBA
MSDEILNRVGIYIDELNRLRLLNPEAEKLRAMSSRSALKSIDKQKMTDTHQMQIIIRERQVELERLHTELTAAQSIEREQKEYLQQLINH